MKINVLDIPIKGSTDSAWLTWWKGLKQQFGKKVAQQEFLKAWATRGDDDANTTTLRQTLAKDGVKIDTGVFGSIADSTEGFIDSIGNALDIGKYFIYAIGGVLVIGIGIGVYSFVKNPISSAASFV